VIARHRSRIEATIAFVFAVAVAGAVAITATATLSGHVGTSGNVVSTDVHEYVDADADEYE
jgi:hypothetical protein